MRKTWTALVGLMLAGSMSNAVAAQESEVFYDSQEMLSLGTPDGQTPSLGNVCDGQTGAAYGLCRAFCEAMDCDSAEPQASEKACKLVGEIFERFTGLGPPCLCPCLNGGIPGFEEALDGELGTLLVCDQMDFGAGNFAILLFTDTGLAPGSQTIPPTIGFCGFGNGTGPFLLTTPEEAAICNDLVGHKAVAAGLVCS